MNDGRAVYATESRGIHDARWIDALVSVGLTPSVVSLEDFQDVGQFVTAVTEVTTGKVPVLAGPLTTVAAPLVNLDTRIVGLSWGYDLLEGGDLSWLPQLDHLIVDSCATQQVAQAVGVAHDHMTFLPWGVDLDVFQSLGSRLDITDRGVPDDASVLLSARAHEAIYRVGDIVSAFAEVHGSFPEWHLVIANNGSLTPSLRAQVTSFGLEDRIHFVGPVEEASMPALLRRADVYVSASIVDGTSVTLLQSMACETPVVVSDIPGNRCWVESGKTGWLFTPSDAQALANALREVLISPWNTVALASRSLIEQKADWIANRVALRAALIPA